MSKKLTMGKEHKENTQKERGNFYFMPLYMRSPRLYLRSTFREFHEHSLGLTDEVIRI